MIRVVIESPFGRRPDGTPCTPAEIERNTRYVRRCVADSLRRGEAPYASHAIYPLVLDDATPAERRMGMEAGFAWGDGGGQEWAVYTDHGETEGMREGIARAEARGLLVHRRSIGAEPALGPVASFEFERGGKRWVLTAEHVEDNADNRDADAADLVLAGAVALRKYALLEAALLWLPTMNISFTDIDMFLEEARELGWNGQITAEDEEL